MEQITPLKDMPPKKRVEHILYYYKIHIIVGLIAIGILGSVIYHYATYREPILSVTMVNPHSDTSDEADEGAYTSECFQEFLAYGGYDRNKDTIGLNRGVFFNVDQAISGGVPANIAALDVQMSACSIHTIITDEKTFNYLCDRSYFMDMSCFSLTEEELAKYEASFFYHTSKEDGKTYAVGIRLPASNSFVKGTQSYDDCVIGFCHMRNDEPTASQDAFLHYLFSTIES